MSNFPQENRPTLIPETGRGFELYAENLGLTPDELEERLGGKDVLDLGAGKNMFGGDIMLRSLDPDYPSPASLTTMDSLYSRQGYQPAKPPKYSLAPVPGFKKVSLSSTDPTIAHFKHQVDTSRRAGDWHHLDFYLGEKSFDVILSNNALLYWSDLAVHTQYTTKPPIHTLKFPQDEKDTFRQIIDHLRPEGVFIGNTHIVRTDWEANPELEQEMKRFFAKLGCDLTVRIGTEKETHGYEFVVFEITKKMD